MKKRELRAEVARLNMRVKVLEGEAFRLQEANLSLFNKASSSDQRSRELLKLRDEIAELKGDLEALRATVKNVASTLLEVAEIGDGPRPERTEAKQDVPCPFVAIRDELGRARAKFPTSEALLAALTEEVGELAKALMDENAGRVYDEAVQVACVAIRIAEEGDSSLASLRARKGLNARKGWKVCRLASPVEAEAAEEAVVGLLARS